jgi:hypothetical protein
MKLAAIPGGDASLSIIFTAGQHKVGFTEHLVGALVAGFGNRLYFGNRVDNGSGIDLFASAVFPLDQGWSIATAGET